MLEGIKTVADSFNRYWLRYGPNFAVVALLIFLYCSVEITSYLINSKGLTLFLIFIIVVGISYILTWPLLILHIHRFSDYDKKKLALYRGKAFGDEETQWNLIEFIQTVRHQREHGNALACVGFSILQLTIILNCLAKRSELKMYLIEVDTKINCVIILLGVLLSLIGLHTWCRAVLLESLELKDGANPRWFVKFFGISLIK